MTKRTFLGVLCALPVFWAVGCGDDDDNGTGPGSGNVEQGQAQFAALFAMDFVNSSVENLDDVFLGNFGGLGGTFARGGTPVWNAEQEAWIYTVSFSDVNGSFSFEWSVQFLADGQVLTSQDLKSDVSAANGMNYSESASIEQNVGDDGTSTFDFANSFSVTEVVGRGAAPLDVMGQGSMDVFDATENEEFGMSWTSDLLVPADDSCPSGTVTLTIDPYRVVSTYNASTSQYTWELFENDQLVANGSETTSCENE